MPMFAFCVSFCVCILAYIYSCEHFIYVRMQINMCLKAKQIKAYGKC